MDKRKVNEPPPHRGVKEPCLYCGTPTCCRDYIINPGAAHEFPNCSRVCFEKTQLFVAYDRRYRTLFYTVLCIFVVVNMFLLGYDVVARWKYLPMFGICIATFLCPLVFTRYERYQKFGILKTQTVIRVVVAVLAVFSIALIISS